MRNPPAHVADVVTALKVVGAQPEVLKQLTDSQWQELLPFCDRAHLTLLLRRNCASYLPEWVRARMDRNLSDNTQRYERIKSLYLEMADAMKASGVEHLLLKGFTHYPAFVDDPRYRMQSDIDLFCPPELIQNARNTLLNLGYETIQGHEHQTDDHLPVMMRKTNWSWGGNHFDPDMPVSVEVHFRFWNDESTRLRPRGLDQFWARRVDRRIDNLSFPGLSPVDALGYAALHLFHHLAGGLTPSHAYELALFLHRNAENEPFWSEWCELHDDLLRRIEAVSFQIAIRWFACRVPREVQEEIDRLPKPVQDWFERYSDAHPLYALTHANKDALWLHLSLLESTRDRLFVFGTSLFPVRLPPASDLRRWRSRTYGWFLKHAFSRVGYHLRTMPRTLWDGARWSLSTNGLGRQFWTYLAAASLFNIGMFIFFFLYNLFLLDYGYSELFLGQARSANALGGIAGAIPAGMLAQRFGLRRTMLASLTLVVLLSASLALFVSASAQLCLAFLASAAATSWLVCTLPAVAQFTNEQNRAFGYSVNTACGIGFGVVASLAGSGLPALLAPVLPAATSGQLKQGSLLVASGVIALAFWPASRLRLAPVPAPEKKLRPSSPFLFRFLAALAIWSVATNAFTPFFNAYCAKFLRMPLRQIGVAFSASQLSSMLAALTAPLLFRKVGLVTGILYTQVAAAVALGCLTRTSAVSGATATYVTYTAFLWMSEPGMFTLLMNRINASERSSASALTLVVMSLASAIAAPLAGRSFARYGYPEAMGMIAAATLAAACMFRLLVGKESVPASQPAGEPRFLANSERPTPGL